MLNLGCHLSTSKGFENMGKDALSIKANTFQFFTRNPRGGAAKSLDLADCQKLNELVQQNHFGLLIAHAPYTLNLSAKDEKLRQFAKNTIIDDLKRLSFIPSACYNLHPGNHVSQGIDKGIDLIVETLTPVFKQSFETLFLFETMSGKGSEIGSTFKEIQTLISRLDNDKRIGVCLDTCHVYSAGYDIVNQLDNVLDEFDRIIGLSRLKAIHLNDSMTPFASKKDRHAKIGEGTIGLDAIIKIINHPLLANLSFCLETPHDNLEGYAKEIALLRQYAS